MNRPVALARRAGIIGLGLIAGALLSACSSVRTVPAGHAIALDSDGGLIDLRTGRPSGRPAQELDAITSQIATSAVAEILVFVPGGLNGFEDARNDSAALVERLAGQSCYPIVVNWDSELGSCYWEHLVWIRRGKAEPCWGPVTSPLYLVGDIGGALVRAPVVWFHQFEVDWKGVHLTEVPYSNECPDGRTSWMHPDVQTVNALYCELRGCMATNSSALSVSLGDHTGGTGPANAVRVASYWVTLPGKMVTSPFLDFMGKNAWENMLRRTQTIYHRPREFDLRAAREQGTAALRTAASRAAGAAAGGGLSQLMDRLARLVKANPGRYRITLIGHSMGTIILNQMIRSYPELPYRNIVYLAAACSINDTANSVVPYLESAPGAECNFYMLTLHPQNDACELHPYVLELCPRGSLLEWIDDFLASPNSYTERTLGKWENVLPATHLFPADIRSRVHIKGFGGPRDGAGFPEGNPQRHRDFTAESFWLPAFWEPHPPAK